jgi:integrase
MNTDIYDWASQYEAYNKWMLRKSLSHKTEKKYAAALKAYCEYRGMDPDELSNEVKQLGPLAAEEKVGDDLSTYQYVLKDVKLRDGTAYADGSIKSLVVAMQSFYSTVFGHRLQVSIKVNPKNRKVSQHIPTRLELRKILSCCNMNEKAIILFQATTGFRIGDMLALKIRDIAGIYDNLTLTVSD